jgi:Kef-type K+ transport system membrane component KefB
LASVGLVAVVYVVARVAGKVGGAWIGGSAGGSDATLKCWIGLAMLPRAGFPIGMALITVNRYPEAANLVLTIVVATTVVFDLAAPVLTRLALKRATAE